MKENWDELIKQQERSGMKPTEFCRARGIDPSKFGYQRWRRKGAQKQEQFVRVDGGARNQNFGTENQNVRHLAEAKH